MEGNIVNYITQIRGVSYKPSDLHDSLNKNSIILLRANNIDEGKINFEDVVYVDKSKVSETQILRENDILICASSGSKNLVGKAASFNGNIECTFGAFCKVIRPRNILGSYLSAFFQSKYYRFHISQFANGANINNIKNEHINSFSIPERTLEEQKEISYKVFSLNRVIENYNRELELLDELVKARFVEMFGEIEDCDRWKSKIWNEVVTIQNGRDYKKVLVNDGGYPVVGTGGEIARASGYLCPENTIVVGRKGSINNPMLMKEKFWNVDTAFGVIPNSDYLHYQYFYYFCKFYNFMKLNKATTLPSTTKADLLKIRINIPPLELQNQFASFVQEVDKSRSRIQKSLEASQELFDSLMQEYFG